MTTIMHAEEPVIVIYAKGQMTLNWCAYALLGSPTHLQQIFDAEKQMIGFAAVAADDPSAFPCTLVQGGMMATIWGLMRQAGIALPAKGMRYVAQGTLHDTVLWFAPRTAIPCRSQKKKEDVQFPWRRPS